MNNLIAFARTVIRNNLGLAATAISLDVIVGIFAATVAFLVFNMVDFSVTQALMLTVSACLAIAGLIFGVYGYLASRGPVGDKTFGFSDEFDFDETEWKDGEPCPCCGQDWTGTL